MHASWETFGDLSLVAARVVRLAAGSSSVVLSHLALLLVRCDARICCHCGRTRVRTPHVTFSFGVTAAFLDQPLDGWAGRAPHQNVSQQCSGRPRCSCDSCGGTSDLIIVLNHHARVSLTHSSAVLGVAVLQLARVLHSYLMCCHMHTTLQLTSCASCVCRSIDR